jgi:hypothetical protein
MLAFTSCEKEKSGSTNIVSISFKETDNENFNEDIEVNLYTVPFSVNIPYNADFNNLVPTIIFEGKSVSPKSKEPYDFINSPKVIVTAENDDIYEYEITIKKTCTYFFDSNGGSDIDAIEVEVGERSFKPKDPILENYELVDWQTMDGLLWDFKDYITENIYLKAKWQYDTVSEDGKWKVVYDGATGGATIIEYLGDKNVENIVIPATINGRKVIGIKGRYEKNDYRTEKIGIFSDERLSGNGGYTNRNKTIKTIDMSSAIYLTKIGIYTFFEMRELVEVKLPPNLNIIDENAFYYCNKLSLIDLNEKLEQIGKWAFSTCDINSIKFPKSLKLLGTQAFIYNDNLTEITFTRYENPLTIFMTDVFDCVKTIYYPTGTDYPNIEKLKYLKEYCDVEWVDIE